MIAPSLLLLQQIFLRTLASFKLHQQHVVIALSMHKFYMLQQQQAKFNVKFNCVELRILHAASMRAFYIAATTNQIQCQVQLSA